MSITLYHIIGIVITLAAVTMLGLYSGKKVKSSSDFSTGGGKAKTALVMGTIMGTLVGGTSTIGTAQLAFVYGLSAWWFTLGAGIGCLVLALVYAKPLRHSGSTTLLQCISKEYGSRAGYLASVLCSIGIFINIIAQLLSGTALVTAVVPLPTIIALLIVAVLMALYVIFGGVWGTGIVGVFKLILIYLSVLVGGVLAWKLSGGLSGLTDTLNQNLVGTALGSFLGLTDAQSVTKMFGNLIARGASKDIGSGISLVLGVLATQTYAQAIWSANSDQTARKGALISAVMIPPVGIGGILVGLYMRNHYVTPDELAALGGVLPEGFLGVLEKTSQTFPQFIVNHMSGPVGMLFGGIALATLLIAVVGTGAGLSLGSATILCNDIFKKISKKMQDAKTSLLVTRLTIVVLLAAALLIAAVVPAAIINDFSFLSMGLRAAVVFIPVCCALWLPGKVSSGMVVASVVAGPISVIIGKFAGLPFDPLFLGIGVCIVLCLIGLVMGQKKKA